MWTEYSGTLVTTTVATIGSCALVLTVLERIHSCSWGQIYHPLFQPVTCSPSRWVHWSRVPFQYFPYRPNLLHTDACRNPLLQAMICGQWRQGDHILLTYHRVWRAITLLLESSTSSPTSTTSPSTPASTTASASTSERHHVWSHCGVSACAIMTR